jgi:membrane protein DedA with SNARE-associated domain
VDPVSDRLLEALPLYGPWLLFALATLETCFVTGLLVPSGVATSVGTVLALDGTLQLPAVVVAALAGGALGDSIGFWIGRKAGEQVLGGEGRAARVITLRHSAVRAWFGRHPLYSVTLARTVSLVRTIMPMAAGMSGLPYRRYLPYELTGLAFWAGLYVAIGVVAQEGWQVATRIVGAGTAAVFVAAGLVLWLTVRRRGRRDRVPREEASG